MRFHFFAFGLVLISGLLFRFTATEMLALLFCASLVLITEMFNTAVEAVVDMITSSYHPAAKFAKDIAAGAVLIAAVNAVTVGCVLFLRGDRMEALRYHVSQPPGMYLFVIAGLVLMMALMVGKILGQKGTLLQGGVVSGHSAIAFFFAFTILFVVNNTFAAILAVLLAFLVAQSRVEARIHTVREVILGAALALFLTASIYRIPTWVVRYLPGGSQFLPAPASQTSPPESTALPPVASP